MNKHPIEKFLRIINYDCLEAMKYMPDNSIDLIITSPPYNLGKYHRTGNKITKILYSDNMKENEYQEWQISVLKECYRILNDNGSMFYNHKNRIKNGKQISPYEWLFKTPFVIKQELVWQNGTPNFDKCRFYPMTERIYWLTKSPETKLFNAINHHDFFSRKDWKPVQTKGFHKRAFPVKMIEDILKCFPESKIVLDPFMGSGTVGVACKNLNKLFIGIEINKEYFEFASKRLKELDNNG